jgi:cob(I)alamin adenosyltransferase
MSRKREEPVRLTRIYTRGGDAGQTSLGGGRRVPKTDALVEAYGTVDELNSAIGFVLAEPKLPEAMREPLARIQNELFDLGADISVPRSSSDKRERLRIDEKRVQALERLCDDFNAELPELRSFVLPGGSEAAARVHLARAICRRAERRALAAAKEQDVNPVAIAYLNRLSDLLFIFARAANAGWDEPLWRPGVP